MRRRDASIRPELCLALFMQKAPHRAQLAARKKMRETTPRHFGTVERKVREMVPLHFRRRRRNPLLIEEDLARWMRLREFDEATDDSSNR
jgi:hypothetical protein